jgi:hypothetical protein
MTDKGQRQPTWPTETTTGPDSTDRSSGRPYTAPVLTEYGSVNELVDSGVIGFAPSSFPD